MGAPLSATMPRTAAVLAPLLSIVIFSRTACRLFALEEPARGGQITVRWKQEIDPLAELVDAAIQVLPLATDQDVRLVHAPRQSDRQLTLSKHRREHRQYLQRPAMNRGVINADATLGHNLLEVAQTQGIRRIPADAYKHDFLREVQPLEHAAKRRIRQMNVQRDHGSILAERLTATEP